MSSIEGGLTTDYNPATDPDFVSDVVNDLREHPHEWRHAGRIVLERRGADCEPVILAEYTYKAVQVARRLGDLVDGDTVLGYRYVGFRQRKFVKVEWASRWPEVPLDDRPHRRRRRAAGQLVLTAEGV